MEGRPAVCQATERVLAPVGAELVACDLADGVVSIAVRVRPTGKLGGWGAATALARAGAGPVAAIPPAALHSER